MPTREQIARAAYEQYEIACLTQGRNWNDETVWLTIADAVLLEEVAARETQSWEQLLANARAEATRLRADVAIKGKEIGRLLIEVSDLCAQVYVLAAERDTLRGAITSALARGYVVPAGHAGLERAL